MKNTFTYYKIKNPTDKTINWSLDYMNNSFSLSFGPRSTVPVRREFVKELLKDNPELENRTEIENDPDYLLNETRKLVERTNQDINFIVKQLGKRRKPFGFFHKLFHCGCV